MHYDPRRLLVLTCALAAIVWPAGAQRHVEVSVAPEGPVLVKTSAAEFELNASGYLRGYLVRNSQKLTLDDPAAGDAGQGDQLISAGKPVHFPGLDFRHAKVTDLHGGIGQAGKRVALTAVGDGGLEKTVALEVYDDFPGAALLTITYRNNGTSPVKLDQVSLQRHRLNASLPNSAVQPYDLWSFHGSAYKWGQDDVIHLTKSFSQPNEIGPTAADRFGGGLPISAFWTRSVGMAIGHAETRPYTIALPVAVSDDQRVTVAVRLNPGTVLKPHEEYSTPRTFTMVYSGDYYEPVAMWSNILQRQGWTLTQPNDSDYQAAWCGWGYLESVTPEQMLKTIPKLKEFGLKWATLDAGWFVNRGQWEPDPKKFPGDSLRNLADEFHKNGIKITIWWDPLAVQDSPGNKKRPAEVSKVLQEHPDWAILDSQGKRGRAVKLCPAVPAVQEYLRQVTVKLIKDYDYDGHKFDGVYSVPPCYNPAHHHKSPEDSVRAMGDAFKVILDTTRQLKPYAVTQTCPCGTTPNMAWVPFMDQGVTGDPVGSLQVRRRIKLYKALLGPRAAVYGDHVELTHIEFDHGKEIDLGEDFASTIGTGGVLGTKFAWPDYGPKFFDATLTPRKEEIWKKWIPIYDAKMLSKGVFRDLYTTGYDAPEGYAIAKDGKMYYGFYADEKTPSWKGTLELRGLEPGQYRVFDYVNNKELGKIQGPNPKLPAEFKTQLLLEVTKL
jgi:alpha-galactosidase